jgi:hypothetical protein
MGASKWVEDVIGFDFNGDDAVVTLIADGEKFILRGKRHVAVSGLAFCARRYQELENAERGKAKRIAEVHPIKRRQPKH